MTRQFEKWGIYHMSMNPAYKPLFESFTFKNGTMLKNRIVMAPMTNFASNDDGTVSESELAYYARRAKGAGMVVTACIYVSPNGQGFPGEFSGASDEMIPGLARLASTIKQNGAKAILQIFHGGRECPPELVPNQDVVSASNVQSKRGSMVWKFTAPTAICSSNFILPGATFEKIAGEAAWRKD
jgi:2,4-dienoyl-CoA reductase-like NADH-dependent reductase (Old Yellow Enzyme family)